MLNLLVVVHIITALLLIILVLLQDSKGGAMGGMLGGGGGSNSLLGATGATSLAAKATRVMAIVFALTSIGLTTYTSNNNASVVDSLAVPVPGQATESLKAAPAEDEDALEDTEATGETTEVEMTEDAPEADAAEGDASETE